MNNTHQDISDADLIRRLGTSQQNSEIEWLADVVAERALREAAGVLFDRLLGSRVQDDEDTEAAVCSALVVLGLMEQTGNLRYRINIAAAAATIQQWTQIKDYLPHKYLG
jgi:hypothetical protein